MPKFPFKHKQEKLFLMFRCIPFYLSINLQSLYTNLRFCCWDSVLVYVNDQLRWKHLNYKQEHEQTQQNCTRNLSWTLTADAGHIYCCNVSKTMKVASAMNVFPQTNQPTNQPPFISHAAPLDFVYLGIKLTYNLKTLITELLFVQFIHTAYVTHWWINMNTDLLKCRLSLTSYIVLVCVINLFYSTISKCQLSHPVHSTTDTGC